MFWIGWYWGFVMGSLYAAPLDEAARPPEQRLATRLIHYDNLDRRDDDDAIVTTEPTLRASTYPSEGNVIFLFGSRSGSRS